MIDDLRGSGRTSRQLSALPDDSIFLVASAKHASHCRALLRHLGRDQRTIRFATTEDFHVFMGARAPAFDVDHAVFEICPYGRASEARCFLRQTVTPYYQRSVPR